MCTHFTFNIALQFVCHALARSNKRKTGIGNSRLRRPSFDLLSSGTEQSKESKRGSRKLNNNSNEWVRVRFTTPDWVNYSLTVESRRMERKQKEGKTKITAPPPIDLHRYRSHLSVCTHNANGSCVPFCGSTPQQSINCKNYSKQCLLRNVGRKFLKRCMFTKRY